MKKYHGSIDGIGLMENEKSQKNENKKSKKNVGFS
jgi:hypothetical protein